MQNLVKIGLVVLKKKMKLQKVGVRQVDRSTNRYQTTGDQTGELD